MRANGLKLILLGLAGLRPGLALSFILFNVLFALSRTAWADGGAIQFQGDSGPFLTAQDSNNPQKTEWMPPACAVTKTGDLSNVTAQPAHGENRLLYGAVVQIPSSGRWQLKAQIQRDAEKTELETLLVVKPALLPPLAYWHLFLFPPVAILGFVLHQVARGKRR